MKNPVCHWDAIHANRPGSNWLKIQLVSNYIRQSITGSNQHWLYWLFNDYIGEKKVERALSIGCGNGDHELTMASRRYVNYLEAFDASSIAIENANNRAVELNLKNIRFHVDTFESFCNWNINSSFDLILMSGSLHHVKPIEELLSKCHNILTADGLLVINEYVGPCYHIHTEERVSMINRLLDCLPDKYKIAPNAKHKNPTIEQCISRDPSEAVRSSLILPFVESLFAFIEKRFYGGSILHILSDYLRVDRIAKETEEANTVLHLLIELERILLENGVLEPDFLFAICKKKTNSSIHT